MSLLLTGAGVDHPPSGGAPTFGVDATAVSGLHSSSPMTFSLTTANANDFILVCVSVNTASPSTITISDTAGLTWTLVKQISVTGGASSYLSVWSAVAPSALSADTITVTAAGANYMAAGAIAIKGSGLGLDPNASLPAGAMGNTNTTMSTTDASDVLVACMRSNNATMGADTGFTITGNSGTYFALEYKQVSVVQSGLAVGVLGGGVNGSNGILAVAVNGS